VMAYMMSFDDKHQIHVIEKMKAYHGSWISKLCPSNMTLPEGISRLVWEYRKSGPPPLFTDVPWITVPVTREHVVLVRPCSNSIQNNRTEK
jgi:hypothetical protein